MTEPHVAVLSQVQQFLDRQHGLYIDGRPGPAQSEKRLAIFDPATGQEIASTADANEADVDNAVMSAWRAFVSRRWAGRLPAERERILLRFADLVEQHSEELAQLETLEQGKSIAISRAFEVGCTLNWMRYTAGLTTKIAGKTLDLSIPLGHPLGMSGARLALAASHELHRRNGRYALCTMCIGVGQGIAMILERV